MTVCDVVGELLLIYLCIYYCDKIIYIRKDYSVFLIEYKNSIYWDFEALHYR